MYPNKQTNKQSKQTNINDLTNILTTHPNSPARWKTTQQQGVAKLWVPAQSFASLFADTSTLSPDSNGENPF